MKVFQRPKKISCSKRVKKIDLMKSFKLFLLPANFTFCTLILPFLITVAMAMLLKNNFIRAQKPKFSVPNKKFR